MSASAGAGGRRVILLGGSSEIGLAIVRELQRRAPREVVLVGRDPSRLQSAASELLAASVARVGTVEVDARATERHPQALDRAFAELGGADVVVLAVGVLGERGAIAADLDGAVEVLSVNVAGAGSLLLGAARRLGEGGGGTLIVLSSVAAERPRAANAIYGASKAGIDALARGVAEALHDQGVRVTVVRPGFVRTRMTHGLEPAPLATDADTVARAAVDGAERERLVVWAPPTLRWLMLVLRMLPRSIFRRLER